MNRFFNAFMLLYFLPFTLFFSSYDNYIDLNPSGSLILIRKSVSYTWLISAQVCMFC